MIKKIYATIDRLSGQISDLTILDNDETFLRIFVNQMHSLPPFFRKDAVAVCVGECRLADDAATLPRICGYEVPSILMDGPAAEAAYIDFMKEDTTEDA